MRATAARNRTVQMDTADRVMVNIHLDGKAGAESVAEAVKRAGGEILALDRSWRAGVISARLPVSAVEATAGLPGVRSVMLAPRPIHHLGRVTAESTLVEHTNVANARGILSATGFTGRGISIGILSDSYDTDFNPGVPRARAGVLAGDLPGPGNPDGYTQPVVLLDDNYDAAAGTEDEGRGMAEIVHDIAPAAKICFHTAGETQAIMALGIRKLRADPAALCDIMVDDVLFLGEPFFSDGELSLAVNDVAAGTTLPGKKVAYFSSAGNSGNFGYSSDFRYLTPAQGLSANGTAGPNQLDFSHVPASLYAGGFHNLNASGPPAIAMEINTDPNGFPAIDFQWDDPFDAGKVTTNYNLLVFDDAGNFRPDLSSYDNNFSTDEPVEFVQLDPASTYFLVITLASAAPPVAKHLRFESVNQASISGPYITTNAIAMAGHSTAAESNAVAAYDYNILNRPNYAVAGFNPNYNPARSNPPPGPYRPALEPFSSNGGALAFYFDAKGNRLATPDVRLKPNFAACDGADTSFFPPFSGSDSDYDGFPNFFGTSAAAPTAAAIGALVLEARGGPQSITPDQMRQLLQNTTQPHDLDPFTSIAAASNGPATVRVTAIGNGSDATAFSTRFFTVTFTGNPGETLDRLVIDLSPTLLAFDESETGFPFTVGFNPGGIVVNETVSPDRRTLTLDFAGTFHAGQTLAFGIDRDFAASQQGGNSADFLAGGEILARMDLSPTLHLGAFVNRLGAGYTIADGYGIVDARNAIESIVGAPSSRTSAATNLSTRGNVGVGDNVLIGGFIATGSANKTVILRGMGPSLAAYHVGNPLADPTLSLYNANGTLIAFNDNWQSNPAQAAQIAAHHLVPRDPRESAFYLDLVPGAYTAAVRGKNATMGISLVEIYDLDAQPAATELTNLSTRGNVGAGDDVLIAGFRLGAGAPANMLVRGIGPSLAAAHVPATLGDPVLTLFNAQGVRIAANDNWQQASDQATQIEAAHLAPGNGLESAINLTLLPGSYTAVLSGGNNTIGNALVQVYHLGQ